MNWKATAVLSGASVLAAWMGISSTPGTPQQTSAVAPRPARAQASLSNIQQEAQHLQARLHPPTAYHEPVRNPFVFEERRAPEPPRSRPAAPPAPVVPVVAAPAPPPFTLAGIGSTEANGAVERTAILSAPGGVVIAHEGDTVDGGYRVDAIDDTGVTLKAGDGTVTRLSLKP